VHFKRWIFPYEQVVIFGKPDPVSEEDLAKEKERIQQQQQQQQQQIPVHKPTRSSQQSVSANTNTPSLSSTARVPVNMNAMNRSAVVSERQSAGVPSFLEKRTWHNMMNVTPNTDLVTFVSKRAKTTSELKDVELLKQIQCSIECGIQKHVDWALSRIAQITAIIPQQVSTKSNEQIGFKIDSIPTLLPTLVQMINRFISEKQKVDSSVNKSYSYLFNNYRGDHTALEEDALVALVILRNCSFVSSNQRVILSSETNQGVSLLDLLLIILDPKQFYIEWRMKVLDILVNCCKYLRLSNIGDSAVDLLFDRLYCCVCGSDSDTYVQLFTGAIEILNNLLCRENRRYNIRIIEDKLKSEKYKEILVTIIDSLKTPTPIHHINEVEMDESDDERDNATEEEEMEDEDTNGNGNNTTTTTNETTNGKETPVSEQVVKESEVLESGTISDIVGAAPPVEEEQKQSKNGNNRKSNEQQEVDTFAKMHELELYSRACALNLLMKLTSFSSLHFQYIMIHTNRFVQRLIQLMVWKSGLQSRMLSSTANMYNLLSHPHRHRHIEATAEKFVTDEEHEGDFDQDEMFDDFGDEEVLSMAANDYQHLSNSQIFQKKCSYILSQLAEHCTLYPNESEALTIRDLLLSHEHEIACLILFTNSYVSQQLVNCIYVLNQSAPVELVEPNH
jgi:hypothetical protein